MAQKSQNATSLDSHPNTTSSTSASKESSATSTAGKQAAAPAVNGTTVSAVLPNMSDPTPPPQNSNSASSQPMEKSASTGSSGSSKDAPNGTASPYGTRSRNRTGTSRINYAEDKDLDVEMFEMYPERRDDDSKKSTRHISVSSGAPLQGNPTRSANTSSRKPLPDEKTTSSSQNGTKEPSLAPTPGSVSGANSTTSAPTSRKRKAASQASGAGSNSQTPAAPNGHTAALQKKLAAVSQTEKGYGETNLLTFDNCGSKPKDGKMVADDGTVLEVNDHVYLVCEPPGEPYYLARIMEFLHAKNDSSGPVDALRINWYYRPKDIGRKVQDTRLVFATMHSDICPLTSLRGKCQIKHKAEIQNMTDYKRSPDSFWYEKLYDRYIQKNYEVIPTAQIVNVPERVKKVLDQRWQFILVEQGRGKELTSAVKLCKRCSGYCASNDSVDCAVCQKTYHMNCVTPALTKKPSRGFAWSCAACSRAQERKLEARNTPNVHDANLDAEEEEFIDEDEDDVVGTGGTTPDEEEHHEPATEEQIYHASLWPYRYLGIHCKVEDALDYDDRIFPRASTRLGPRHQANVLPWAGRPVEYVKPLEIKKSTRKDGKLSKEVQAALEQERIKKEKRPKWIQDEPAGYVARGEDFDNEDPRNTAQLLWKPPPRDEDGALDTILDKAIDDYMEEARSMAKTLGLPPHSTNLQDAARDTMFENKYDGAKSLRQLPKLDKSVFKEPDLTPAEQKKFEEAVQKFGSELHSVMKHVKTVTPGNITRYYYTWKKTERGRQVWGNYASRKGKKEAKKAEATASKLADDVADGHDDSAFDTEKALERKKSFMCKFCSTKTSRQWRRAPNASTTLISEGGAKNANKDKNGQYIQALCRRCAELWRRYAIQWEDIDEVAKKVAQTGGRGWRRRVDEELYKELLAADEMISKTQYRTPDPASAASPANGQQGGQEPPRKKLKGSADADRNGPDSSSAAQSKKKEKAAEKPAPPPVPEIPKPKTMPCAICLQLEPLGDQHLSCRECRMSVHRNCYGIVDNRAPGKWTCDMCLNDKNPQVSIHYKCVLCPVEHTEHDFVEAPKPTGTKKKTEKDRERERVERELAVKAAEYYKKKQEETNRPVNPREPLKRTADNNWVHVTCAVWTPEVKFAMAKALGPCEGIPSIPRARYAEVCKACKKQGGACVACHHCRAPVHVECAHQAGYLLGFDITPVKGSRRDQFNIVTINGDSGTMTAAVWCKEHVPSKTVVHKMQDPVDDGGLNALQLYVQNFKQADLTLTGCARKANQISLATKMSAPAPTTQSNRRASATALVNGDRPDLSPTSTQPGGKVCLTCGVDVSPKWHSIDQTQERGLTNGHYGNLGTEAQKFVEQRSFQCHKCKRANRQPISHQPKARTPSPEPIRKMSHTPPPPPPPEPIHSSRDPYPWSPQMRGAPPLAPAPAPIAPPPPLQAPVLGPMTAPIGPPPVAPPPIGQSQLPPTIAPRGPPVPAHAYPPPSNSYNDWHHRPSQHGPHHVHPHREINGGPPPMVPNAIPHLAPPNHLRPPPPMPPMSHHQPQQPPPPPPAMHSSHVSQPPFSNGLPPSPRRLSGPPPVQNGSPSYMPPYHHSVNHQPDYGSTTGQQLSSILRHGTPLSTPHGSPPSARDSLPMGRDSNRPPLPPQRDGRPASGASASPSLRNLLS